MAIQNKRSSDAKPESPAEKRVKFDKKYSTSGEKKPFSKPGAGKSNEPIVVTVVDLLFVS